MIAVPTDTGVTGAGVTGAGVTVEETLSRGERQPPQCSHSLDASAACVEAGRTAEMGV